MVLQRAICCLHRTLCTHRPSDTHQRDLFTYTININYFVCALIPRTKVSRDEYSLAPSGTTIVVQGVKNRLISFSIDLHSVTRHYSLLKVCDKLFGNEAFFGFNCMFYQLLRVQHSCSSTQSCTTSTTIYC